MARKGVVSVGTAPDSDLVLSDDAVSRRHFEVHLRRGEPRLRDSGSTNGTRVDGVRVVEAYLTPASRIEVGQSVIQVVSRDEPVSIPLSTRDHFGALLGGSRAMRQLFGVLECVAPNDTTVLIEGETGSGKELVAEAIHSESARADRPLVTFDCGAVSAQLIESELFGHVRGAFTGAQGDRRGVFEEAHGGTLFLDEIGELPLELQPKLLRALESRTVRRVGDNFKPRDIDVRLIAATNRNLSEQVNSGDFREDLYYRLAVVHVRVPPLRERREDIPLLVRHFVSSLGGDPNLLGGKVLEALMHRPWPGNVRELRNVVERAIVLAQRNAGAPSAKVDAVASELSDWFQSLLSLPIREATAEWSQRFERRYLEQLLERSGGSVTQAAITAQTNRRYLQRLIKRHGIRKPALGHSMQPDEPYDD